ncbi:MAG: ABC transporter permease [Candidatus Thorarchaeota archaeon]|nr:ABC transporter permease [Candidatus Thorarchaeota archaeon]
MSRSIRKSDWRDTNWYVAIRDFATQYSKHKVGVIGLVVLCTYIGIAIFAPYLVEYSPSPTNKVAPSFLAPAWLQFFDPNGVVTGEYVDDPSFDTHAPVIVNGTSGQFSSSYHPRNELDDPAYQELVWTHIANQSVLFRSPPDITGNLPDAQDFIYMYRDLEWAKNRLPSDVNMTIEFGVSLTDDFLSDEYGGLMFRVYIWLIDSSGEWTKVYQSSPPYSDIFQRRRVDLSFLDIKRAWQGMIEDSSGNQPDDNDTLRIAVGLAPTRGFSSKLSLNGSVVVRVSHLSMIVYGDYFGRMGTTDKGADAWSQLIYGTRVSLLIGITATALSSIVGVSVGMVSGYYGGKVDEVIMRTVDFLLVIPGLPFMMILAAFLGPGTSNIIIVIAILGWTGTSRLIRSQVMAEKNKSYVESARAIGASDAYILYRHILPNVAPILFADVTLGVVGAILSESGLAFLGLTDPAEPSWGRMLADAQNSGGFSNGAWWVVMFPGLAITILSLSFTFVGHTLDQVLNPRLRER